MHGIFIASILPQPFCSVKSGMLCWNNSMLERATGCMLENFACDPTALIQLMTFRRKVEAVLATSIFFIPHADII